MTKNDFQDYFKGVKGKFSTGTEFTPRTDLENLLNNTKPSKKIKIIQEPSKEDGIKGRPDFKVEINGVTIGYIETKAINIPLDDIIEKKLKRDSEQLKKYLKVIPNLILTNYNEFILFRNGEPVDRGLLFYPTDKKLDLNNVPKVSKILDTFFSVTPERITTAKKLSHLLANRTRLFKEFLDDLIESGEDNDFKSRLVGTGGLHDVIKETLIEDLSLHDFIDAYVQTITYGLFLAEINSQDEITEENASRSIPNSMGILKELFKTIDIEDIPDSIDWIIEEIIDILNLVDHEKINNNLSFSKLYQDEDPYVYFYENFLAAYDKKNRKAKGVYYTPIPVVKFIVESIDYLISQNFNEEGLKGEDVKILDFATGTGTFLLESFMKALENTDDGVKKSLIRERLLKNFYGFEYLMAPYTIAHLKLSQYLKENGYPLEDNERLKIYLTDTLDNSKHEGLSYFQKITKEGKDANQIKLEENVLVLMGNPPYNVSSKNKKKWILKLSETYKKGLDEKNIQPLNDDYIKFIRYAHWKIEKNGKGIVGIISNNSYIDGLIHRVMRKELLKTFDQIYILNLHGNKLKGDPDENVFDIMAGVNIALFVKLEKPLKEKEVYYYSTLDKGITDRELKYGFLLANNVSDVDWNQIKPKNPDYWFIEKDLHLESEYNNGWALTDIFKDYNSGIQTGKDKLFIGYSQPDLEKRMKQLLSGKFNEEFKEEYGVPEEGKDISIKKINKLEFKSDKIIKTLYRPFDMRWIYYDPIVISRARYNIMQSFLENENLGLISVRQFIENKTFNHAFITNNIVDRRITLSNRGAGYLFPLYQGKKLEVEKHKTFVSETVQNPYQYLNPQPNFTENFTSFVSNKYSNLPTPEEILGYIYAFLYSRTYREKYNGFLKTDFPRIPFVDEWDNFVELSRLGSELIDVHLLKKAYVNSEFASYPIDGDNVIDKIKYDKKSNKLYINKD